MPDMPEMRDSATPHEDDDFVELRGSLPRWQIDVMDAVIKATPGESRIGLMRQIVAKWCKAEIHKATLIHRLTRGNGNGMEP